MSKNQDELVFGTYHQLKQNYLFIALFFLAYNNIIYFSLGEL
jgi:hypothetical protein